MWLYLSKEGLMPCPYHTNAGTYPSTNINRVGLMLCNAPETIVLICDTGSVAQTYHSDSLGEGPEADMLSLAFDRPNCEDARDVLLNLNVPCQACGKLHTNWEVRPCNVAVSSGAD